MVPSVGLVAGDEPAVEFPSHRNSMQPVQTGDVGDELARVLVEHHDVRTARDVDVSSVRIYRHVVPAALAAEMYGPSNDRVLTIAPELDGQKFTALNDGPSLLSLEQSRLSCGATRSRKRMTIARSSPPGQRDSVWLK